MGDSEQFYNIFYNLIQNKIANFINLDQNLRNIISVEDQKKHILNNVFLNYDNNADNAINLLNNNLDLYLQIIHFVKTQECPYMPGLIDFTKIPYVFNRFMYHYAKLCMNNQCVFSSDIYIRILNIQYIQN